MGYDNPAYVAVHCGFEAQIDDAGSPDGLDVHRTGAIYAEHGQALSLAPALPPGEWNRYEIRVEGQTYTVRLNGRQVSRYDNRRDGRGAPSKPNAPTFVGLQAHTGTVAFCDIQLEAL